MTRLASIHDVAKYAGVSSATVSKVLNNYPNISEQTRSKVDAAIEHLMYRPNVVARGLAKKRSWTIGIFLNNSFTNPFVAELLLGAKQSLANSGYDLIYLSMILNDPSYCFIRHCHSRNVDGILVFGIDKDNPQLRELVSHELPSMFIDTELLGRRAGYITADNQNGIIAAVAHLVELGHRNIAFISGEFGYVAGRGRFEGYQQGLRKFGLPYYTNYIEFGHFTKDGGYAAMRSILQLPERPTAVICTSDLMAIGAINAIHDYGLQVPNDMSVIGFDDTAYAQIVKPSLTTVNQNIPSIGARAVRSLIEMIETPDYSPPVLIEPVKLIIRESTSRRRGWDGQ